MSLLELSIFPDTLHDITITIGKLTLSVHLAILVASFVYVSNFPSIGALAVLQIILPFTCVYITLIFACVLVCTVAMHLIVYVLTLVNVSFNPSVGPISIPHTILSITNVVCPISIPVLSMPLFAPMLVSLAIP